MENEKYGIELEAKTNAFIKGIKEASKYVKAFSEGVKESFNEQVNKSFNDFKDIKDKMFGKNQKIEIPEIKGGYQKQIEYVKNQLKDIEEQKKNAFKLVPISNTEQNMTKLNDYKKTLEDLDSVIKEQQEINAKMGIPDSKSKIIESLMNDKAKYEKAINEMVKVEPDTEKINELEIQYETLENKLLRLENKQEEYNDSLEEMGNDGKKSTSILSSLFDNSIGKIKRFTYYLLGARSVFSMFMKYQGIYYQYNEQMQYQTELSQNAIALSLAPAFEFLGNVVTYASIAFAKFIELLTGVNVLSKVSTKGIRDYNKSLKETQTLVSGIDEITNLTNPGNLGLASQYQALDDFRKKIAEVEKWFNENPWVKEIADGIKSIYNYIKDHWDIFKYILGGVAIGLLSKSFSFGITVVGLGAFIEFVNAIKEYNKASEEYDKNHKETHDLILNNFKKMTNNYFKDMEKRMKNTAKNTKQWSEYVKDVKSVLPSVLKEIENGELTYEEYGPVIDTWIKKLQNLDEETFEPEIKFLTKLNGSKDDLSLIKAYFLTGSPNVKFATGGGGTGAFGGGGFSGSRDLNYNVNVDTKEATNKIIDVGKTGVNSVQSIINKVNELTKKNYKIKFTTEIISSVAKGATSGALALSEAISKAIKGYANGLDYVPYDNYPAVLHKGEAVVPAKYNPTIHSQGNEYTNSLLETLIIKVDDLSKRPIELDIDGNKFAETTYPLYENARSRNNYIEGVVR